MFNMRHELLGESIFTSFRSWDGEIFGLDLHLDRLYTGVKRCYGLNSVSLEQFKKHFFDAERLIALVKSHPNHYFRLTFYADSEINLNKFKFGLAEISLDIKIKAVPASKQKITVQSISYPFSESFRPVKSGSYFYYLDRRKEALRNGFDDAIFISDGGDLLELSTANICFVNQAGEFYFPKGEHLFQGTTTQMFQQFLLSSQRKVRLINVNIDTISQFTSAYALNAVSLIRKISKIADQNFDILEDEKLIFEFKNYLKESHSQWKSHLQ
jgi:branched-subunit amino acid aminotransferase/4-amino-4-deoxychorismate lyase